VTRVYKPATPLKIALEEVEAWFESPTLVLLAETDGHWPELRALATAAHASGPLIHDARIAALCRQHGVRELWSADRDFSRFPGLTVVNPLVR
jgi:predicted nucleic acid-binding protein